ncbi:LisH domain-containing protein armc9 [Lobulomyces angularis]|nr:LisH domain-containing protein armc9 [Lobulomyces angularis]
MLLEADREIELNGIVIEYLEFAEYPSSHAAFNREALLKGRPTSSSKIRVENISRDSNSNEERTQEIQNRFIIAFHEGDREAFFSLWDKTFSAQVRSRDPVYQKLEFTFSIYFAIFPIHNSVRATAQKKYSIEDTMQTLKEYLGTRGSDLCKTTQFLSFYALPYVPDPTQHPSFKDLFSKRWVEEIEERLKNFLSQALRKKQCPRLLTLLNKKDVHISEEYQNLSSQNRDLKSTLRQYEEKERNMISKHRTLQNDYHNLIMIASELVQTLASCINGEQITPSYLQSICQRLSTFKKSQIVEKTSLSEIQSTPIADKQVDTSHSNQPHVHYSRKAEQDYNDNDNPVTENNLSVFPNQNNTDSDAVTSNSIDFSLIKNEFEKIADNNEITRTSILLLEALGHEYMGITTHKKRKSFIQNLVEIDLLNLNADKSFVEKVFESSTPAKYQLSKFLNLITSESLGRSYVLSHLQSNHSQKVKNPSTKIVACLIDVLLEEGLIDSNYKQNILGTLQKLSLRRFAQSIIIKHNVIPHLMEILKYSNSEHQFSDYTVEFSTALLMNLNLRSAGRDAIFNQKKGKEIIKILINLLRNSENDKIKSFCLSIFYNLFLENRFLTLGRDCGVERVLEDVKDDLDECFFRQCSFVLELLENDDAEHDINDSVSEDGEEYDVDDYEDPDAEIEETDEAEETIANVDETFGSQLLRKYTCKNQKLNSGSINQYKNYKKNIVNSSTLSLKETLLSEMKRPQTPTSRSNTPTPRKILPKVALAATHNYKKEDGSDNEDKEILIIKPRPPKTVVTDQE